MKINMENESLIAELPISTRGINNITCFQVKNIRSIVTLKKSG